MRPPRNGNVHVQARPEWISKSLRLPRRKVRLSDILAAFLMTVGATSVFLLVVALGVGSAWLIIAIVQDLARRFGG